MGYLNKIYISRAGSFALVLTLSACAGPVMRTDRGQDASWREGFPKHSSYSNSQASPGSSRESRLESEGALSSPVINGGRMPASAPASQMMLKEGASGGGASAEYHFSMAQAHAAEGKTERAIEEYRLALTHDPKSSLIHTRLAAEYVKKASLSDALDTAKKAVELNPKNADARMILGAIYSGMGDSSGALHQYDQVLKQKPSNEDAALSKAQILFDSNRVGEGVLALKSFLKADPESPVGWYYLARAEHARDNYKGAEEALQKALDLRPSFTQAAMFMGFLFEERKQVSKALSVYHRFYDETHDVAAAHRISTIFLKNGKYREAIPYLEAIQAADPEDINSRVKLGLVYMELKNYAQSVTIFEAILAKHPQADRIHFYLGSIYEETGRREDAVASFLQVQPDSKLYRDSVLHAAFLLKGQTPGEEGESSGKRSAMGVIDGALEKSPKETAFYLFKANLEEEAKDLRSASRTLEKASAYFPDDERILYYWGSLLDRLGESDKGLSKMEAILKVNPDHADALNYIGYTYTTRGIRLDDAEKYLRRALALRPEDGYIRDSWGWYLFTRGRLTEAVVELEKAAKMKPNEATILEHLADAYVRSNLRTKALVKYQEALRVARDDERGKIQEKLQNLQTEFAEGGATPAGKEVRKPASEE